MILLCCNPLITHTKIGTICKSKASDLHINQTRWDGLQKAAVSTHYTGNACPVLIQCHALKPFPSWVKPKFLLKSPAEGSRMVCLKQSITPNSMSKGSHVTRYHRTEQPEQLWKLHQPLKIQFPTHSLNCSNIMGIYNNRVKPFSTVNLEHLGSSL